WASFPSTCRSGRSGPAPSRRAAIPTVERSGFFSPRSLRLDGAGLAPDSYYAAAGDWLTALRRNGHSSGRRLEGTSNLRERHFQHRPREGIEVGFRADQVNRAVHVNVFS